MRSCWLCKQPIVLEQLELWIASGASRRWRLTAGESPVLTFQALRQLLTSAASIWFDDLPIYASRTAPTSSPSNAPWKIVQLERSFPSVSLPFSCLSLLHCLDDVTRHPILTLPLIVLYINSIISFVVVPFHYPPPLSVGPRGSDRRHWRFVGRILVGRDV